jgi:hypothetical protein
MSGQFTRRELLRSSVVVGAASTLAVNSARGANPRSSVPNPLSPKSLKLGLMSYTLAQDWDIDTIIKNCKETGFEHIELRTTHAHGVEVTMSKEQRQTVRQRFEDAGLRISLASGFAYHYPDPSQLRKEIEGTKEYTILAQDVGAIGVRVFPNALPGGKGPDSAANRQVAGGGLHVRARSRRRYPPGNPRQRHEHRRQGQTDG